MEVLDRIQARLRKAFDDGTGFGPWSPSKSKIIEFLGWTFEQFCGDEKFQISDLYKFRPMTAPQGRPMFKPTDHQYSVATKITCDDLQRQPTHEEVIKFIRRNPDVGKFQREVGK